MTDLVRDVVTQYLAPPDDRARARANALNAFAVRVASAALLYVMQVILARWMGGFEYGVYVFVWTWVLILGGLSPLGLNVVAIRLIPEYSETNQNELLRGLYLGTRGLALATGTVVALVGMAGLYTFEDYVANHYVLPIYLALVCIPLFALGDMHDGLGRGQAWIGIALVAPYIVRPVLILAFMGIAYLLELPMVAATAAASAILATWIASIGQLIAFEIRLRQSDQKHRAEPSNATAHATSSGHANTYRFDFKTWLTISAPLLVINACELLLQYTDVLIISHYLTPEDVGIYFAAAKTMSLIMFVHYAVGSAVANRFSAMNARGDSEGLRAFVSDAVNWTFWPSLAAAIALLALGKPLLALFGEAFVTDGYPVMFILVVGFLVRSAMGPSDFLLNMLGEQRLCAIVLVATAILNVVLNLVMIPLYGTPGAAIATASSLSVAALSHWLAVRVRLNLDVAIWNNIKRPGNSGK